jgi:hypothetical protein
MATKYFLYDWKYEREFFDRKIIIKASAVIVAASRVASMYGTVFPGL